MMNIIVVFIPTGLAKATWGHKKTTAFGTGGDSVQVQNRRIGKFFDFLFQAVVTVLITVVTILDTGDLNSKEIVSFDMCKHFLKSL